VNTDDVVTKTIKTYEEFAEEYRKRHFDDLEKIENFADFFVRNLKGKRVLDAGCGPGRDARYFTDKGLEVIGIDLASNFIKVASQNVPNARFVQMDIRALNFPENFFDGIWASASFLHIPKEDAKRTLWGFRKVLKPSGLLYLSVMEGSGEKMVEKKAYKGKARFFAFYTKDEIKKLLEACDFRILKLIVEKEKNKKHTWINVFAVKE